MIEIDLPRLHVLAPATAAGCLVAIDAGATKTQALAYDLETGATTNARSGSGNQDAVGSGRAVTNIAAAIHEAAGGRPIRGVLLACAGTAAAEVRHGIGELFAASEYVEVVNDVIGAWGSAFGGEDGFALISGTGSHGVGVVGGKAVRVGGWGHIFGDEGSAFALGRAAIAACLYALDGRGPQTSLTSLLGEHAGGQNVADFASSLYASNNLKAETAALAQVLDRAAIDGDVVSQQIIEIGGRGLAAHISALADALPIKEGLSVGLVGSTWKSEHLRDAFHAALHKAGGVLATVRAEPVEREPVEGVLALLLRVTGNTAALPSLGW